MKKTASQTQVVMTQLVLPNDTNNLDNLRGGKLLHWMDLAAAVKAAIAHHTCVNDFTSACSWN